MEFIYEVNNFKNLYFSHTCLVVTLRDYKQFHQTQIQLEKIKRKNTIGNLGKAVGGRCLVVPQLVFVSGCATSSAFLKKVWNISVGRNARQHLDFLGGTSFLFGGWSCAEKLVGECVCVQGSTGPGSAQGLGNPQKRWQWEDSLGFARLSLSWQNPQGSD